jgi:16S rRNA (guanine(966)-N(2))-methyltransferase RsmD
VTGGIFRSRPLRAPHGDATRPTSDRVREALFSILGASRSFDGARALDLYAGTGALAIEAVSRGASFAVVVENGRDALAAIRENVRTLGLDARVRVVAHAVDRAAGTLASEAPFDFVFADPPYAIATTEAPRAIAKIVAAGLLAPGGVVVLEHASKSAPPPFDDLVTEQTRRYGDTALTLYSRPDES